MTRTTMRRNARWLLGLYVLSSALVLGMPGRAAAVQPLPDSMDALGDSITRGYGTNGSASDFPARSYSTGTDPGVNSLYQRILALNPAIAGQNHNHASDGSKMAALNSQMVSAVNVSADLVTVMIGAGDVCLAATEAQMTPVATFRAQFEQAMNTFSTGLSDSRVLVLSVPNVYRMWEVLKNDPAARAAWSSHTFCDVMFDNPLSTAQADVDRRNAFRQRIIDYDSQLEAVCAQYSQCTFDGNTVFDLGFVASDVSTVDYFHPSRQWHTKVAEALAPFVASPNQAPRAGDETYATSAGSDLAVPAPGVLANDDDADGDELSAVLVSGPTSGTLTFNSDGSFSYTPQLLFVGTDSFTYMASDGRDSSPPATVTLRVNAVNLPPVAGDDAYATDEDVTLVVPAPGVTGNDIDPNVDPFTVAVVDAPDFGGLTLNGDGSFAYTPNPNANGTDTFTYQASDGGASSNAATVTLTVNPVPDPPVADAGADQTVRPRTAITLDASGSSDPDGDPLTYHWTKIAGPAAVIRDEDETTPDAQVDGVTGPKTFTFRVTVTDPSGRTSTDDVVVTVKSK